MAPDARKTLKVLREEWKDCTLCELHARRIEHQSPVFLGKGKKRGIMFIGAAPDAEEERNQELYSNTAGRIMRRILEHQHITNYYLTYAAACRACTPFLGEGGAPEYTRGWSGHPPELKYRDQPATLPQMKACAPRLYEEIYMADPIVIVALGQSVASFLLGSSVKLSSERGVPMEIEIPGAGVHPKLTQKKKEWRRKVGGVYTLPVEQNMVKYLMVPTFDPKSVEEQKNDLTGAPPGRPDLPNNPFDCFARDLLLARTIYTRYCSEVYGVVPEEYEEEIPRDLLNDEDTDV